VPNVSTLDLNTRHSHELEVIPLDNGNYRLATVVEYTTSISSDNYHSLLVMDFDPLGNLISSQTADYVNSGSDFYIKGLEFSNNGERLYVSHTKSGSNQSSLDVFDLTGPVPVRSVISTSDDYQYSQIEATFGDVLLISKVNGLSRIDNASSPTYTFTENTTSLLGYNIVNPYEPIPGAGNPKHDMVLLQDQIDGYDYKKIPNDVYH